LVGYQEEYTIPAVSESAVEEVFGVRRLKMGDE
jgi:hypothetical protein